MNLGEKYLYITDEFDGYTETEAIVTEIADDHAILETDDGLRLWYDEMTKDMFILISATAKALSVNIFKHNAEDFSNHGISSRFDEILLLCDDGNIDIDLANPPANLCTFVKRDLWGEEHDYIRPYAEPKGAGWMNGGTICYSSDARFRGNHPLCLHDRDESWEIYNKLN